MTGKSLAELIAAAAREMEGETDPGATMDTAVALALDLVPHAEHAGISLIHRNGRIDTPATSSDVVSRVDQLQLEHNEGPCLDAIRESEVVRSPSVADDDRWPRWGQHVAKETEVRSMLCFRLFTHEDRLGALNLYSGRTDAFDEDDVEHGLAIAAHAAIAVAAAQEIAHLRAAVDSRTIIGQAQGMFMERYGLEAGRAFALLVRLSQESNRRLREIAEDVTHRRDLLR